MHLTRFHGKKRSNTGTLLYIVAVLVKVIGVILSYLVISENSAFMLYFGIVSDYEEQGLSTLYWGSIVMGLQVGILLYSLTHDNYQLGRQDKRPWMKGIVFLWSPVHVCFVIFRDRMYNVLGWEYGIMVLLDLLIFIGLASKTGSSQANSLRPFKDEKQKLRMDREELPQNDGSVEDSFVSSRSPVRRNHRDHDRHIRDIGHHVPSRENGQSMDQMNPSIESPNPPQIRVDQRY